jgi:hypothetical protein
MSALNRVTSVSLTQESGIGGIYAAVSLADAYSIELPPEASTNPELLARFIFSQQPAWIRNLTAVRDMLVAGLGLKTAKNLESLAANNRASRVAFLKIYSTSQTEIVLGEDDKHLDFRVSVLCLGQSSLTGKRQLVMSTVVHCHNRLGRLYIRLIAPFHRLIVQASLRHAARVGWPVADRSALTQ